MSTDAAKSALAAHLLDKSPTPAGAIRIEPLLAELQKEGHNKSDCKAALFEMKEAGLVDQKEHAETYTPPLSLLQTMPEGVFGTRIPRPKPTVISYQLVWPLPPLRDWWKERQKAGKKAPPTPEPPAQLSNSHEATAFTPSNSPVSEQLDRQYAEQLWQRSPLEPSSA